MKHGIGSRDFNRSTLASLARKGVRITGLQGLPGPDGSFANGERGYLLDDNGTGKVRTFMQVLAMAVSS
jgi:hypothetical protein